MVQAFAAKMNITVAPEPNRQMAESLDTMDVSYANLALAAFTKTVNESAGSMSALTETVNVLAESVGELGVEVDTVSAKLSTMVPDRNGPPHIRNAD